MSNVPSEPELVSQCSNRKPRGFFVEVGANEPKAGSQTWFLESCGWCGILVEPLPRLAARLRDERPNSTVVQAACGPVDHSPMVELHEAKSSVHSGLRKNNIDTRDRYVAVHQVPMFSMDEILAQAGHPAVDFVSIDVEGMELYVLRGFDIARHKPAPLLIEDHLFDLRAHLHLRRAGYRLVKRTGLNNWYVSKGARFDSTTAFERVKLWCKVWPGTVFRGAKHNWDVRRQTSEKQ